MLQITDDIVNGLRFPTMNNKYSKKTVAVDTGEDQPFSYAIEQLSVKGITHDYKCDFAAFQCDCADGFISHDKRCIDVDECQEFAHICGSDECVNLPGSYDCRKESLTNVFRGGYMRSGSGPLLLGKMLNIHERSYST